MSVCDRQRGRGGVLQVVNWLAENHEGRMSGPAFPFDFNSRVCGRRPICLINLPSTIAVNGNSLKLD